MELVRSIPTGWAKVRLAARVADVPIDRANALILSGAIPVAIDGSGYMWVSVDSLRNGITHGR